MTLRSCVKTCVLAAGLVLVPVMVQAQLPFDGGAPVTRKTVADVQEMIRVADALDAAVDAKDWTAARALFTDQIAVDFTSLAGGEPATVPADALVETWAGNLKPSKTSFHLRGNHRVSFTDKNAAVMHSTGYAWNRLEEGARPENGGEPMWEVWGNYTHTFERMDDAWRITGMTFTMTAQRGNAFVRDTIPAE